MDYLEKKRVLLGSILENTQAQTKLIQEDDIDALEILIDERAIIMAQVDDLDQVVSALGIDASHEQKEPIKALLSQIITLDTANQTLMKKELVNIQGELHKIRTGRQQEEHYGTEYGIYKEEGVFFDTRE